MYLFIEQEIPHYRVGTLNALNKSLEGKLVVYSGKCSSESSLIEGFPDDMKFKHQYSNSRWVLKGRLFWINYFEVLRSAKCWVGEIDAIILRDSIRAPLLIPFILYCRLKSIPIILWGQAYSRKRAFNPKTNLIDCLHLLKLKVCSAYVVYSDDIRQKISEWLNSKKVFVANNTIDLGFDKKLSDSAPGIGNSRTEKTIVFIGRLQKRKKVDILLRAVSLLLKEDSLKLKILLVGEGEEGRSLKVLAEQLKLPDICWLGELDFAESMPILQQADVVVIPGWLGLAVNHAFSFGVPIITEFPNSEKTNHPPEIEYFKDGVNGLSYKSDSPEALAQTILRYFKNQEMYSRGAIETFHSEMSIDSMIAGFTSALSYVESH